MPEAHGVAVLAAAAFLDEYDLTPFDALHVRLVTIGEQRVPLTSSSA